MKFTKSRGPEPSIDPASVTERQRTVLTALDGALRVEELVQKLGGHPNTTRAQLRSLESKGLVTHEWATPHGRGRPAARYHRTEAGEAIVNGAVHLSDTMSKLAEVLTEELATQPDASARAHELGQQWGRDEAEATGPVDPAESPVQRLTRLAARFGFAPEVTGDRICLRRCPLLQLARKYPHVVCSMHLGVLEGLLHGSDSAAVRLEAFTAHGCGVTVTCPA